MKTQAVKNVLSGDCSVDELIRIQDGYERVAIQKAGFSFLGVHDGSCFAPLQVIADSQLDNYQDEVKKLTTGCAVEVHAAP